MSLTSLTATTVFCSSTPLLCCKSSAAAAVRWAFSQFLRRAFIFGLPKTSWRSKYLRRRSRSSKFLHCRSWPKPAEESQWFTGDEGYVSLIMGNTAFSRKEQR
ncbi:hypothetical protein Salat_2832500 [Sesamum alatum]|uniref:Uncharacterized protein n=1 Tax=Sesamum alatum TaxID=300844 RepID=A0AAE1XMQ6_9LAMI|nr:hypothetical protein Salat_2832500 [Sesamum alatum]